MSRVLLVGYGNPGRLDDGLGPAVAEHLEGLGLPDVTVQSDYQLSVELAEELRRHELILFADAAVSGAAPFEVREVTPADGSSFSTHSVSPAELLGLARRLFGTNCRGFTLGIRGYAFDAFGERLSPQATENLAAAVAFIERVLRGDTLDLLVERAEPEPRVDPKKAMSDTAA
ncbi:MAG: hydrogenase maturation protease [Polyangiaceae bacterium]|nr:hydrogenase maturation protease [Polyangiaceae bacterium]